MKDKSESVKKEVGQTYASEMGDLLNSRGIPNLYPYVRCYPVRSIAEHVICRGQNRVVCNTLQYLSDV